MSKVIISIAPVAASTSIDSQKLAADVTKCVAKGAAMCHLHCLTTDGALTENTDFFRDCFDHICEGSDVIVQASTGGVSAMNIEQRCTPLSYSKVESASLNGGSTNLGESIYMNSFEDIRYCAKAVYEKHILPEIEVFDIGMIHAVEKIASEYAFRDPLLFNLVFGHQGVMPAAIKNLMAFQSFVPSYAKWGVTHYGRDNWQFLAAAIAMGASVVRIGFEDSNYLTKDTTAQYNWQLVEKLTALIHAMGLETATPQEARQILQIRG